MHTPSGYSYYTAQQYSNRKDSLMHQYSWSQKQTSRFGRLQCKIFTKSVQCLGRKFSTNDKKSARVACIHFSLINEQKERTKKKGTEKEEHKKKDWCRLLESRTSPNVFRLSSRASGTDLHTPADTSKASHVKR